MGIGGNLGEFHWLYGKGSERIPELATLELGKEYRAIMEFSIEPEKPNFTRTAFR